MRFVITSDLDGTLLNDKSEISEYTRDLLNTLVKNDILFIPCTSRSVKDLPQCLLDTDLRYFVCANGASIYDKDEDKIIKSYPISSELAFSVLDAIDLENTFVSVVSKGQVYSEKRFFKIFKEENLFKLSSILSMEETRIGLDSVYDKLKEFDEIEKLHLNYRDTETRDANLARIKVSDEYMLLQSSPRNIEVTHSETDKGRAALALCDILGLEDVKVMAFGDNINDIPLFNVADVKVKMKNGLDALDEHTNAITDYTNDEDGVARFISKTLYE